MGTVYAIEIFNQLGFFEVESEAKKKIVQALDMIAKRLGNTRAVCKKYYVHPVILDLYQNNQLKKFLETAKDKAEEKFSDAEDILMKILETA
jgi:DNA topoisomerase-1